MDSQNSSSQIVKELEQVILAGDERKAKDFLIDNFKSFPEDWQQEIARAFLEEGLDKAIDTKLAEYQRKAQGALELCEMVKQELAENK